MNRRISLFIRDARSKGGDQRQQGTFVISNEYTVRLVERAIATRTRNQ